MHRVVGFVFKFLGITVISLILFDAILMLMDTYITQSRVQAQATLMQQELAKNNYISEKADEVFRGSVTEVGGKKTGSGFAYIEDLSKVYTSIDYNYDELNEDNIGNYGDFKTLKITCDLNTWIYTFNGKFDGGLNRLDHNVTVTYTYVVPCLRYLK